MSFADRATDDKSEARTARTTLSSAHHLIEAVEDTLGKRRIKPNAMILDANNSPRLDHLDFERNVGPFARPDISTGVGDKIDHKLHEGAGIHVEALRLLGHPHFKVELMSASDKSYGTPDERSDLSCLRMNGKASALNLCRRQPVAHDVIEMIKGSSSKPPSLNDGGADLFKRVTFDQVLKSVESSRER